MKIRTTYLKSLYKFSCFFILIAATACVSTSKMLVDDNYSFERSENNPMIYPDMEGLEGVLGKNINGPSVIKVPNWVENPLGKYYMYFADHHGKYLRLAYANAPMGPWTVYKPGVLHIDNTAAKGHIASPDVIIDEASKTIRMYFHGYNQDKSGQKTFVSTSKDGVNFTASETILGPSYFRVFKYKGDYYALVTGTFYRSKDGLTPFEKGVNILPKARHTAVTLSGDKLIVFYSQKGDAPERILKCEVNLSDGIWKNWKASAQEEVLKPEMDYEGVKLPIQESVSGFSKVPVHELRDPAIFIDKNDVYLYYSISGEFGIAVAKLKKSI
ncbi:hypothetical protein EV196_103322 [Mariniflexile fucanivorans]|uniref:Glycosyl hydrolase family 43 n=1 Tax=Mariniflexile fucanivorans TaxID=264023 RepID=A0A4R1RM73_9FLAO|nr:hypothetical protein [Mariniflexile fucanivorans]TCL66902.1 hypothetical protein EV196_103322 [Mariniflexile fucanivorans]